MILDECVRKQKPMKVRDLQIQGSKSEFRSSKLELRNQECLRGGETMRNLTS